MCRNSQVAEEVYREKSAERRAELAARFEIEATPHLPMLNRFAARLTNNKTEAEDLVQETMIQALGFFDRYQSGTNCRAWLCQIMRYKRAQWIRANNRFCVLDEETLLISAKSGFEQILPPDYVGEKVRLSLRCVPEKFRRVLWLCDVQEFTYRESAAHLGIPIGTVMSRLARARKMLRVEFMNRSIKTVSVNFSN